jgi:hypothetical protein
MAQRAWDAYQRVWKEWEMPTGLTLSWPFMLLGEAIWEREDDPWRAPKSQVKPTWGSHYVKLRKVGTWGTLPTSSTKKG